MPTEADCRCVVMIMIAVLAPGTIMVVVLAPRPIAFATRRPCFLGPTWGGRIFGGT
jgi:hypothetical protein